MTPITIHDIGTEVIRRDGKRVEVKEVFHRQFLASDGIWRDTNGSLTPLGTTPKDVVARFAEHGADA